MQYSVVNYKTVKENSDFRIDAEYFKLEYLKIEKRLENKNSKSLNKIIPDKNIVCGPFGSAILASDYVDEGFPLLRVLNLHNFFLNTSDLKFINSNKAKFLSRYKVSKNDIVVSQRGSTAEFSLIKDDQEYLISANLISIKNSKNINFNFLITFLNCLFGKKQLEKTITGQVQEKITTANIKNIKIPYLSEPFQLYIEKIIELVYQKQIKTSQFYYEAEQLLLTELGLLDWKPKHELAFVKNFSDTKKAERFDAEYFQLKYEEIFEAVKKYKNGWDLLKNQFTIINGQTPEKYFDEEEDVQVLKTKQIRNDAIQYNDVVYTSKELALNILKNKDILFASMGVGSLGRTGIFYSFETNKMTSVDGTIKILRQKKIIKPEVLQVYFNSLVGQEYIYRYIVGSTGIISIKNDSIQNLLVPLIEIPTQKKIAELIQESHEKKKLSKSLLEIAKRGVEMAIEKDEKEAKKWIDNKLKGLQVSL